MSDQTVEWLRGLAEKGGKGVVNNIDARCLGRIADELELLRSQVERMTWRPIETCELPAFDKDRWYMDVLSCLGATNNYFLGRIDYGYTERGKGRWRDARGYICNPTHWMPSPPIPSTESKEGAA